MMQIARRCIVTVALLGVAVAATHAAESTKDIVLDRVSPTVMSAGAAARTNDAMAVSVLLESPDGSLTPRGTDRVFHTGDRFRVKILASRNAKVALYNTNPRGELGREPIWRGEVELGQEVVSPRLRLDGASGVDYLHIVMEPTTQAQGMFAWLGSWLRLSKDAGAKDIRLDVQNTASTTYLLNPNGQGLVTTVAISHR